jgi:hypothetical protein
MRVATVGIAGTADGRHPGVKPTAFVSEKSGKLVIHVVNAQNKDAAIAMKLTGKLAAATSAERLRTSAEEDMASLPALKIANGSLANDTLPARSMVTYVIESGSK